MLGSLNCFLATAIDIYLCTKRRDIQYRRLREKGVGGWRTGKVHG